MFYFYLVLFVLFLSCCCYVLSRAKYSIARDNLCVCFFGTISYLLDLNNKLMAFLFASMHISD